MLAIDQLIKILLGIAVVAAVVVGIYFFGAQIMGFFKNLPGGGEQAKLILALAK